MPTSKNKMPSRFFCHPTHSFSLGLKNNLRKAAPTQPKIKTLIMSEVVRNFLLKIIIQKPLPTSTRPITRKITEVTTVYFLQLDLWEFPPGRGVDDARRFIDRDVGELAELVRNELVQEFAVFVEDEDPVVFRIENVDVRSFRGDKHLGRV